MLIVSSCFQYLFALQTFSLLVHISVGVTNSNESSTEGFYLPPSEYEDFYKLRLLYITDRVIDDYEKRFEIISIAQKKYFNKVKTKLVIIDYNTVTFNTDDERNQFNLSNYVVNKWHKVASRVDFAVFVTSAEFANSNKTSKDNCRMKPISLSVGSNWEVEKHALDLAMQMGYVPGEDELNIGLHDDCIRKDIYYQFYQYFSVNFCGNGIRDRNEECDYETFGYRKNDSYIIHSQKACINCTLQSDAECLNEPCCNSTTFKIMPAGTMCRKSRGYCDTPEYCDGINKFCPTNVGLKGCRFLLYTQICSNNGRLNTAGSCDCRTGFAGQYCQFMCPNCCGGSSHANFCYKNKAKRKTITRDIASSQLLSTMGLKLKFTGSNVENSADQYFLKSLMDGKKCNYFDNYYINQLSKYSWLRVDMLDIRRVTYVVVYTSLSYKFDLHLQVDEMSPLNSRCQTINYKSINEKDKHVGCTIQHYQCFVDAQLLTIQSHDRRIQISEVEIYVTKQGNQLPVIRTEEWIMEKKQFCDWSCNESELQDSQNQTYSVAYLESIYYISYLKISTTSSESDSFDCEIKTSLFHEQQKPLIGCDQSEVKRLDNNGEYFVSCRSYGSLIIMNCRQGQYRLQSVHGTKQGIPISLYKNVKGRPSSMKLSELVNGDTRLPSRRITYVRVDLLLQYHVESVVVYLKMSSTNNLAVKKYATVHVKRFKRQKRQLCKPRRYFNNTNVTEQLLFSCNIYSRYVIVKILNDAELDIKQILVFGHRDDSLLNADYLTTTSFDGKFDYQFLIDKHYNFRLNKSNCRRLDSAGNWSIQFNSVYVIDRVQIVAQYDSRIRATLKMEFGKYWNSPLKFTKTLDKLILSNLPIFQVNAFASFVVLTSSPGLTLCELMFFGHKVKISPMSDYLTDRKYTIQKQPESISLEELDNYLSNQTDRVKFSKKSVQLNDIQMIKGVSIVVNPQPVTIVEIFILATLIESDGVNSTSQCAHSIIRSRARMIFLECNAAVNQINYIIGTPIDEDFREFKMMVMRSEFLGLSPKLKNTSISNYKLYKGKFQSAIYGRFNCLPEYQGSITFPNNEVVFVEHDLRRIYHLENVKVSFNTVRRNLQNGSQSDIQMSFNIKIKKRYRYTPLSQFDGMPQYVRYLKINFYARNSVSVDLCKITVIPVENDKRRNIALSKPIHDADINSPYHQYYRTNIVTDGVSGNPDYFYKVTTNIAIDLDMFYVITDVILTIHDYNIPERPNNTLGGNSRPISDEQGNYLLLDNLFGLETGLNLKEWQPIHCNHFARNFDLHTIHNANCSSEGRYVKVYLKSSETIKITEVTVYGEKKISMWKPWNEAVTKENLTAEIQLWYLSRDCKLDNETLQEFPDLCPVGEEVDNTYLFNIAEIPKSQTKLPSRILRLKRIDEDEWKFSGKMVTTFISQLNLFQVMHIDGIVYRHDKSPMIKSLKFILYKTKEDSNYQKFVHAVKRIRNYFTARCKMYATKSIDILTVGERNNLNIRNLNIYGFKAILCDAVIPTDNDLSTPRLLPEENIYCDLRNPENSWMILYKKTSPTFKNYNWTTFKEGFELTNASGFDFYRGNDPNFANLIDFYIGNDRIHNLSAMGDKLQIRLVFSKRLDIDYMSENYVYNMFYMEDEANNFKIKFKTPGRRILIDRGSRYSQGRDRSFQYANGRNFSTIDRDNDNDEERHCAVIRKTAGWFGECKEDSISSTKPERLFLPVDRYPYQFIYARFLRKVTYNL